MAVQFPDITPAMWSELVDLTNNGSITSEELEAKIKAVNGSPTSQARSETIIMSAGTITIYRHGRFSWWAVDGVSGLETLIQIIDQNTNSPGAFATGDILRLSLFSPARNVIIQDTTAATLNGGDFQLSTSASFIELIFDGTNWNEYARHPAAWQQNPVSGRLSFDSEDSTIDSLNDLLATKSHVRAFSELAGSVEAEADFQIINGGSQGSIEVFVNEGLGSKSIGKYSYSVPKTTTEVAAGIESAINSPAGAYSASSVTDTVTVTAPAGSGSAGNGYVLSFVITLDTTASIITNFTGGSDGNYQDAIIGSVSGLTAFQDLIIENGMVSNDIILDSNETGSNLGFDYRILIPPGKAHRFFWTGSELNSMGGEGKKERSLQLGPALWTENPGAIGTFGPIVFSGSQVYEHSHAGLASLIVDISFYIPFDFYKFAKNGLRIITFTSDLGNTLNTTLINESTATTDPAISSLSILPGTIDTEEEALMTPSGSYAPDDHAELSITSELIVSNNSTHWANYRLIYWAN